MKPEPDDLKNLLREWRELPACDAGLPERVVRDVSGGAKRQVARGLSPQLTLAVIVAGVMTGVAAAEWRARHRDTVEMPQQYLAWIDPLPGSQAAHP